MKNIKKPRIRTFRVRIISVDENGNILFLNKTPRNKKLIIKNPFKSWHKSI